MPSSVYLWNGLPLIEDGKVAVHQDCCCAGIDLPCCTNSLPGVIWGQICWNKGPSVDCASHVTGLDDGDSFQLTYIGNQGFVAGIGYDVTVWEGSIEFIKVWYGCYKVGGTSAPWTVGCWYKFTNSCTPNNWSLFVDAACPEGAREFDYGNCVSGSDAFAGNFILFTGCDASDCPAGQNQLDMFIYESEP